ncbi:MAG TPA: GDP-mannose 4,6-dehydratase [Longimicrobium sp.]|nr:GDP-mannose 4,6-dehydratase [Longimicrobium sp.]
MRVLVTGAAGFAGSWLVRTLVSEGHTVFGTRLHGTSEAPAPGVRWITMDVTSEPSVRAAVEASRPQAVFHLAGQASVGYSLDHPELTRAVNATGTRHVAAALPDGARLLLVSSGEVYGDVPEAEQPIPETRPPRPDNPYAESKADAEAAVLEAAASGRVEAVIARAFNHTGPGQDPRFAVAGWARRLAEIRAGEVEPVLPVGNLSIRRDWLDVRDVVRAYLRLMEAGEPGGVYNVCSGQALRLREVVDELVELSGTDARVEVDPARFRAKDIPLLLGDNTRLRGLGWAPSIPLRRTLAELLEGCRPSPASDAAA